MVWCGDIVLTVGISRTKGSGAMNELANKVLHLHLYV